MKCLKFILVFLLCVNCNSSKSAKAKEDYNNVVNILFIGNSLTYTNNLPELVETTAEKKERHIKTKMIALPNYALLDHWKDGTIQKEIRTKQYDYVIVQQGPSSQDFGKGILIDYGKKYSALCKENNAQLCFFMIWPSLTYFNTFDGVIENHREAATLNDALLLPVGEVWKAYFDATGKLDYYSTDGFHPSVKGSQVAAEVIIDYLFRK